MQTRFSGWTPREAVARCVDHALLLNLRKAHKAWEAIGFQKRFVVGVVSFWDGEGNAQFQRDKINRKIRDEFERAEHEVWNDLRRNLVSELLVAFGRRGSPTAEAQLIAGPAWRYLQFRSGGRAREPDKTVIYDVRIFPALLAPDAGVRLNGLPLQTALKRFVAEDPQVSKRISQNPSGTSFGYPMCRRKAVWSAVQKDRSIFSRPIGILNPRDRRAVVADAILTSRFLRLMNLCAEGAVVGEGLQLGSPPVSLIPNALWQHPDTYVDIATGDVLRFDTDAGDFVLLYSAVSIRLSQGQIGRASESSVIPFAATSPRRSASAKAVTECREWLVTEMRNNPNGRPKSKDAYWLDAQKRWGERLTKRSFLSVWPESVRSSGAIAWSAPGAPRKKVAK